MIEDCTQGAVCKPIYDFCFIDGAQNWSIDGLAFFLVDKLLKPGGWLLFDDLKWTYAEKEKRKDISDGVTIRALGEDEKLQPHVELVFELLVKQHPHYS